RLTLVSARARAQPEPARRVLPSPERVASTPASTKLSFEACQARVGYRPDAATGHRAVGGACIACSRMLGGERCAPRARTGAEPCRRLGRRGFDGPRRSAAHTGCPLDELGADRACAPRARARK